jgi:hypothetical protein
LGTKLDCRKNGFAGQPRVRLQELLNSLTSSQLLQDVLDCDPSAPNNRFTHHHAGIALTRESSNCDPKHVKVQRFMGSGICIIPIPHA